MPPPWDDAECAGVPLAASGDSSDEQGFAAADSKGPADGPKTGDARELLPWPVEPHGHSRKQAAFMYGCAEKGSVLLQQIFPLLLSKVGPPHARSPAAPPARSV